MVRSLGVYGAALLLCAGLVFVPGPGVAMPISQYPAGGRERVTAHIDIPYDAFYQDGQVVGSVMVDGEELAPGADYRHRGGSIVIELLPDYLESLEPGTYPITVRYEGGEAQSTFTVGVSDGVPNIRSRNSPWVFLLGACLMALIGVSVLERRQKEADHQAEETPEGHRA